MTAGCKCVLDRADRTRHRNKTDTCSTRFHRCSRQPARSSFVAQSNQCVTPRTSSSTCTTPPRPSSESRSSKTRKSRPSPSPSSTSRLFVSSSTRLSPAVIVPNGNSSTRPKLFLRPNLNSPSTFAQPCKMPGLPERTRAKRGPSFSTCLRLSRWPLPTTTPTKYVGQTGGQLEYGFHAFADLENYF